MARSRGEEEGEGTEWRDEEGRRSLEPLRRRNGQDRRRRDQARLRGARRISPPPSPISTPPPPRFPLLALPLCQPPLCSRVSRSTVASFFPPPPCVFVPSSPFPPLHSSSIPLRPSHQPPRRSIGILPPSFSFSPSLFSPSSSFLRTDIFPVSCFSFVALARPAHPSSSSLLGEIRPIAASCPSLRSISLSPNPPPRSRWRAAGSPAKTSIRRSPVAPWYTDRART